MIKFKVRHGQKSRISEIKTINTKLKTCENIEMQSLKYPKESKIATSNKFGILPDFRNIPSTSTTKATNNQNQKKQWVPPITITSKVYNYQNLIKDYLVLHFLNITISKFSLIIKKQKFLFII